MVVMTGQVEFQLRQSHSLKDKRQISRSVLRRLPRALPVQVAEVEHQDNYGLLVLGLVAVGVDRDHLRNLIWRATAWLEEALQTDAVSAVVDER